MKHSVFIFTYNRSNLLKRQLRLFKLLDINSKIYLLDGSSNVEEIKRNKKIASDFEINYFYEKSSYFGKFAKIFSKLLCFIAKNSKLSLECGWAKF